MLRTILTVLDGSQADSAVVELGVEWAKRFQALMVGVGVIDEPGIHGPEELLVGKDYFRTLDQQLVDDLCRKAEQALGQAALCCAEAGVAFKPLEEVGRPVEVVREEAQRFDLILLSRAARLEFDGSEQAGALASRIMKDSPRPLVVVPESLRHGKSVVIAYDGSVPSARALAAFESAGLGRDRTIRILSIAVDGLTAARRADRAVEFLRAHDIRAEAHPVVSEESPALLIMRLAREWEAELIVAGAYGQPALREFFIGSTTRTLLQESPAPLFVYH